MRRKSGVVLSAILCMSMFFTACQGKETVKEETAAVLVEAQEAGRDTLILSSQFVGTVSPQESVYVIPMAQGTVTETFFEVGDEVQAGDVLFQIDDSVAKLQLEQAKLSYASAKGQADSALTTQQESASLQLETSVSQAETAYASAQVTWKNAKDSLSSIEDAVEKLEKQIKEMKKNGTEQSVLDESKKSLKELKSQKEQAEMAYNVAETAYDAATTAYNAAKASKELTQGAVYEDTKEQLNTTLQLAQVAVDSAELALSYYTVTSPISGKVISKAVEVNGMAGASAAYTIAGEDTMTVTFQVSESVMNTLSKGQNITVERNGAEFAGTITEIGNAVNMQTGLFQIKASVQADGAALPSGVSVTISSDTYIAENAVIIPYDAVYFENEGAYVYVAKEGHAVKTYVTTGIFDDTRIQIAEGITEGDVIITSWSPRLIDGAEVDVKLSENGAEPENSAQ